MVFYLAILMLKQHNWMYHLWKTFLNLKHEFVSYKNTLVEYNNSDIVFLYLN